MNNLRLCSLLIQHLRGALILLIGRVCIVVQCSVCLLVVAIGAESAHLERAQTGHFLHAAQQVVHRFATRKDRLRGDLAGALRVA